MKKYANKRCGSTHVRPPLQSEFRGQGSHATPPPVRLKYPATQVQAARAAEPGGDSVCAGHAVQLSDFTLSE